MCRRDTADPLVNLFHDRYRINLLATPRELSTCGDVYVKRGGTISAPGALAEILDGSVALPPTRSERLAKLAGSRSDKVDFNLGIGLLAGFLAALGAGGVVNEVAAGYQHGEARNLTFRLENATREFMDPLSLGTALHGRAFKTDHPWVQPRSQYFVIAAVIRTPSLTLAAEDETSNAVNLDVEVVELINAHSGLSATRQDTGEVRYEADTSLAIGVELYQLRARRGRFQMLTPKAALDIKQGRPTPAPPAAFPGAQDEALLTLA